jgi:hypothetical protein
MISIPDSMIFNITPNAEGDFVEGIDFIVKSNVKGEEIITPVIKKDTTYLVVHEITQELVTITEDSYAIQLGAFKNKANADILRRRLERLLGRKVEIVIEDDYYKVRIIEIKERKEVDEIIETLRKEGVTELWVISLKAKRQQLVMVEKQDTVVQVKEFTTFDPSFYKLELKGAPVIDPTVLEEMKRLKPIDQVKFRDIWMAPVISAPSEEIYVIPPKDVPDERPDLTLEKVLNIPDIPGFVKPYSALILAERKIKLPVITSQPTIALQVAVFQKESEANQAKRKITSRLKLPVEIIKQWDSYYVIITGFRTREETYPYYPELAGLGFPSVRLIEDYIRQE